MRTARTPSSHRLVQQVLPLRAAPLKRGATLIPVANAIGFRDGQTISIDTGANAATAVIASIRRFGASSITVTSPLTYAHAAGAQVSGTGITLSVALTRERAGGAVAHGVDGLLAARAARRESGSAGGAPLRMRLSCAETYYPAASPRHRKMTPATRRSKTRVG